MSERLKAFAISFVIAAGVLVAPPAAFANGGCNNAPWSVNGWHAAACISASGSTIRPDFYVNARAGQDNGCRVIAWRHRNNGTSTEVFNYRCEHISVGHYGPFNATVATGPGICYYTRVRIGPIGGAYLHVSSPNWCY